MQTARPGLPLAPGISFYAVILSYLEATTNGVHDAKNHNQKFLYGAAMILSASIKASKRSV